MKVKELKRLLLDRLRGALWCYLEVDAVEWTGPQYYHQN